MTKFDLGVKIGQDQPRAIILTILVVIVYTLLHTTIQVYRSLGSGKDDFQGFHHIWA